MRARDLGVHSAVERVKEAVGLSSTPDETLRPSRLSDIVGQREAVKQLELLCSAALMRSEPVCHVLMSGPPGLGKTSLAYAVGNEMQAELFATTADTVGPEQLAKILGSGKPNRMIFLDEIHMLSKGCQITLLGALEDGWVDVSTPVGPQRRQVLPFTLIGATTNPGALSAPLKQRFGHTVELEYYSFEDLEVLAKRTADYLQMDISPEALADIADRSQQTPRITNQLIMRVRDWHLINGMDDLISSVVTEEAFAFFGVDALGLGKRDREYLRILHTRFRDGPVGEVNLAIALGMDTKTVSEEIEPFMLRAGLIGKAPRGRVLLPDGIARVRELEEEDKS